MWFCTGVAAGLAVGVASKERSPIARSAVCVMHPNEYGVEGFVILKSVGKRTQFECHLTNLPPGYHGFHVHKSGDLREGCDSTCSHYNPDNKTHGGVIGGDRHKGDLGNVYAGVNGVCEDKILADVTVEEIVGRAIVIHKDKDDLGQGNDEESLKTGNAGKRIACGVIALL